MKKLIFAFSLGLAFFASGEYIVLNEDNDHYFKLEPEMMDVPHLEAYVDRLARGGKVTHIFFCPTGQRASFDSKVWEPIWTGLQEYPENEIWHLFLRWSKNAKALHDKGIDPYKVWIDRCRKRGISPWLTPRMNDCHDGAADLSKPYRSITLWRQRKDLRCYPGYDKPSWGHHHFNYEHKEVRDSALAMLAELFERYDFDGIEIDGGIWFPKERAQECASLMDEFFREIKKMAMQWEKKRGHRILIAAKIAHEPNLCRRLGCDVSKWVRQGIVDWVVCPNAYEVPVEKWRSEFGERKDAKVLCGLNYAYHPGRNLPRSLITGDMYRGWADACWGRGADGLYLHNLQYHPVEQAEIADKGLSKESLNCMMRSYPALWGLPLEVEKGGDLRFAAGANTAGEITLELAFADAVPEQLKIGLNGVSGTFLRDGIKTDWWREEIDKSNRLVSSLKSKIYKFPSGSVKNGVNTLKVEPGSKATLVRAEIFIAPGRGN